MARKDSTYCGMPASPVETPILRELFWPAEWLGLVLSPVYRGRGVIKGSRQPVVLVPGFLASDASLNEMHLWLERIGYDAHVSGIGRNLDCPDVLLAKLIEHLEEVRGDHAKVRLVGHSLGGTLARAAAVLRPELVAQVITLGAPIRDLRVHPWVMRLARAVEEITPTPDDAPRSHNGHVHAGDCSCELLQAMSSPFPVEVSRASIYSRSDGIVDWRSSEDDPPGVNRVVQASHIGLVVNAQAYRAISELLAVTVAAPAKEIAAAV